MRIALAFLLAASSAHAGDLCGPSVQHRGATTSPAEPGRAAPPKAARSVIDLDLERADVRAALRLVADAAKLGLVLGDDITGTVTIHLKSVPWDAAACAIANIARVELELADKILIAKKAR